LFPEARGKKPLIFPPEIRRCGMKKNMGTIDRVIRTLLAIVVLILYLTDVISGVVAIILGIIAVIFLLTSVVSFCPLYSLLKFSTMKKEETT
jgi:hypothetical protein